MTRKRSGTSPSTSPCTQNARPRKTGNTAIEQKRNAKCPVKEDRIEKRPPLHPATRPGEEFVLTVEPHNCLPWWERWLYLVGWCGIAAYSCYSVYIVSRDNEEDLNEYDFSQGWKILGRRKDISNFEWDFWTEWFVKMLPWLLGHIVVGQIVRWKFFKYRRFIFLAYGLVVVTIMMGVPMVLLFLSPCLLTYAAAWTGSAILTWLVSLACLSTLNFDPFTTWMKSLVENDPFEKRYYLMLFTLAMLNLRYTSFCHEWCMVKGKQASAGTVADHQGASSPSGSSENQTTFRVADMLTFCFYLPMMFTGPLMTYHEFHKQISAPSRPWGRSAITELVMDTLRVLAWAAICELVLHYFYFNSIQHNVFLMGKLPLWALAGVGYCQGQFFMVKYVVMFGLPRNISRLDQLDPPAGPKCIARIYLYSEMWKYFDRGLYAFMKRHIYIPLGGSHRGIPRQLVASLCCFLFVYYWHGAEDYLLLWVMLNFLGITLETLASQISRLPSIIHIQNQWLTAACRRRLQAIVAIPLHALSTLAIFTFFGGTTVGSIFYHRLLFEGWPTSTLTVAVSLYCLIQTSIEISLWENRKKKVD